MTDFKGHTPCKNHTNMNGFYIGHKAGMACMICRNCHQMVYLLSEPDKETREVPIDEVIERLTKAEQEK